MAGAVAAETEAEVGHAKIFLFDAAIMLGRQLKRKADALDEAFLKRADPRAVQGGATCEEADHWRAMAKEAYALADRIRDQD